MISKDRWEKVETIYHGALAHDPDSRESFLTQACGGDQALRSEVDSLLKFDDASGKFIETPAIELEAKAIADEENAFRTKSQLGRGLQIDAACFQAVGQFGCEAGRYEKRHD